jgi:hypothetical protein
MEKLTFIRKILPALTVPAPPHHASLDAQLEREDVYVIEGGEKWGLRGGSNAPSPTPTPSPQIKKTLPWPRWLPPVLSPLQTLPLLLLQAKLPQPPSAVIEIGKNLQ